MMVDKNLYKNGLRFECQGSGKCCQSRGEYGYVYFTLYDRQRAAKTLGIKTQEFTKKYCQKVEGAFALKDNPKSQDCIFLNKNRCGIYSGRPTQCRTWPFWPEVMNAKKWTQDVAKFCPGVGKGKIYSKEEIEKTLREQVRCDRAVAKEAGDL